MTTTTQLDLDSLNGGFEKADPAAIAQWAVEYFGEDLVMSSSFGAESAVLLHMATQLKPNLRIIFVNTGYLFPETHRFMEELRLRLKLNVWLYRTANDPIAWLRNNGEENPAWRKNVEACCAANKVEPFERAIQQLQPRGWLRGIRRHQTETRRSRQFVEWVPRYRCHAISPLLNWGARQMHAYLKKYDLPYHPLFERGFASIGCNPLSCTRAVGEGQDPRSGRWAGNGKLECGINLNNSLDSANL